MKRKEHTKRREEKKQSAKGGREMNIQKGRRRIKKREEKGGIYRKGGRDAYRKERCKREKEKEIYRKGRRERNSDVDPDLWIRMERYKSGSGSRTNMP